METETPDSGESSLSGSFLQDLQSAEDGMEIQKGILCHDGFLNHKRTEIAGYFAMEQDARLQADYLKNSFRMKEYTEFDIGVTRAGYLADEDGLTMWKGKYLTREAETKISWEDVRFFVNSSMKIFEALDEISDFEIVDIDTDDLKNIFTVETADGSIFEIECRKLV